MINNNQKLITSSVALEPSLILKDDADLLYQIVDIFPRSMIVEPFPNPQNFSCEVITYRCFVEEQWKVVGKAF